MVNLLQKLAPEAVATEADVEVDESGSDVKRLKSGIRLFWALSVASGVFFTCAWIVEARESGHGTGFGDGIVYPRGQSMVRGKLDGIGAANHVTSYPRDAALIALTIVCYAILLAVCYFIVSRFSSRGTDSASLVVEDTAYETTNPFERLHRGTQRVCTFLIVGEVLICGVGFPIAIIAYATGHPLA